MTSLDISKSLKKTQMRKFLFTHFSEIVQNANSAEISEVKHFSPEAACHFFDSRFFTIIRRVVLTASLLS